MNRPEPFVPEYLTLDTSLSLLTQIHTLHSKVADGELTRKQAEAALVFGCYAPDWPVAEAIMQTDPIALEAQLERDFMFRARPFVDAAALGARPDPGAQAAFRSALLRLSNEARVGVRSAEDAAMQLVMDNHPVTYPQAITIMRHLDSIFTRMISSAEVVQGACIAAQRAGVPPPEQSSLGR
jgi:hypothetical protein